MMGLFTCIWWCALTTQSVEPHANQQAYSAYLYGRITLVDGGSYEGRMRFGSSEEAAWDHYFNGRKMVNPWRTHIPDNALTQSESFTLLGVDLGERDVAKDLTRPFMVRFGDIARIDAKHRELNVTLKSGTVVKLDRFEADDYADGVRIWDVHHGVMDLTEWQIQSIAFLETPPLPETPVRLHGTVTTAGHSFTGFLQWDREISLRDDMLVSGDGTSIPFAQIQSLRKHTADSIAVTTTAGKRLTMQGSRATGENNRGVYVEDHRFGRVLVPFQSFEQLTLTDPAQQPVANGPAYSGFAVPQPLFGSITRFDGEPISGRIVFDLDESESAETLDAPAHGVHYTIPFERLRKLIRHSKHATQTPSFLVQLRDNTELTLTAQGDLGPDNGGILVFAQANTRKAEYIPWASIQTMEFVTP